MNLKPFIAAALALLVLASAGCKKEEKQEDINALLKDDPAKALEILQQRLQDDQGNYETRRQLAQAYSKVTPPKWERAGAYYKAALEHETGQIPENKAVLQGELLTCLEAQIADGRASGLEEKKLVALLLDANQLEKDLARQDIKAGKSLFERVKKRFDKAVTDEQYDKALLISKKLDAIYVDEKTRRTILDQLPKVLGMKFTQQTELAFEEKIRPKLEEFGVYDVEQKAFKLPGRVTVTVGEEGQPDPKSPDFAKVVETSACSEEAARPRLKAVLNPFAAASPLGRPLSEKEIAQFHVFSKDKRKTFWEGEAWDATKEYEPGTQLKFTCEDRLSLDTVINAFMILHKKDAKPPAQ